MSSSALISSALLPNGGALSTPQWSSSGITVEPTSVAPNETPFNLAFNTKLPFFEWMGEKRPEDNAFIREGDAKIFAMAMQGAKSVEGSVNKGVLEGFNWRELPEGSVVVDVGGGVGAQALVLAKQFKKLKFVVQDREEVVKAGEAYWEANYPAAVESGRVVLQG